MWRSLMRTTPACSETWKPASWPRPTTNSVEPPPTSITTVGSLAFGSALRSSLADSSGVIGAGLAGHRAEERELRLFLALENTSVKSVLVAQALGELLAVLGVAHG